MFFMYAHRTLELTSDKSLYLLMAIVKEEEGGGGVCLRVQ